MAARGPRRGGGTRGGHRALWRRGDVLGPRRERPAPCPGSLRAALTEVTRDFTAASGIPVVPVFGASGLLRDRLERGEPGDVFASANMEHPEALARSGKAGPVVMFARNRLCALARPEVGVTADTLLDRLLDPAVTLGTSTPRADPAGNYAWEVFRRAEALRPAARPGSRRRRANSSRDQRSDEATRASWTACSHSPRPRPRRQRPTGVSTGPRWPSGEPWGGRPGVSGRTVVPVLDLIEAIGDPHLFGPWFEPGPTGGPGWSFLQALFGLADDPGRGRDLHPLHRAHDAAHDGRSRSLARGRPPRRQVADRRPHRGVPRVLQVLPPHPRARRAGRRDGARRGPGAGPRGLRLHRGAPRPGPDAGGPHRRTGPRKRFTSGTGS